MLVSGSVQGGNFSEQVSTCNITRPREAVEGSGLWSPEAPALPAVNLGGWSRWDAGPGLIGLPRVTRSLGRKRGERLSLIFPAAQFWAEVCIFHCPCVHPAKPAVPGTVHPIEWKEVETRPVKSQLCEQHGARRGSLYSGIRWLTAGRDEDVLAEPGGFDLHHVHRGSGNFLGRWQGFPKPNANRCLTFTSSSLPEAMQVHAKKTLVCKLENVDFYRVFLFE